jgi:hypothetical protein
MSRFETRTDRKRLGMDFTRNLLMPQQFKSGLIAFAVVALACASPCLGQTVQSAPAPAADQISQEQQSTVLPGTISGTIVDESGAVVAGAHVKLTEESQSSDGPYSNDQSLNVPSLNDQSAKSPTPNQETLSGNDGQFSFGNVTPGAFQLTITVAGFATQTSSGTLHSGEYYIAPKIALTVATAVTEVQVSLTQKELAEKEIRIEEKQRVLGVLPNFYVTYNPDAVPLTSKQKFKLAWKTSVDPVGFAFIGGIAGIEQAQNDFPGYGGGAQGYGKRYGASYADFISGTFIGGAILPSLLKQDPRYFYKGTGSKRSRFLYAVANSVICKGDNGHWQANYSNIIGSFAAGGISNLYYPAQDRQGAALTFETGAIGLGTTAAMNFVQEFFMKKLTPKLPGKGPNQDPAKP